MGLFEGLQRGGLGVEVTFPPTVKPFSREETSFRFVGPRTDVDWWVFFFPDIALDLSAPGWSTLRRDITRQTRILFEQMFRSRPETAGREFRGPRTRDETWSPVVDVERVSIDGGSALFVLHRMTYEPGSEILMGHLLIPCAMGLVEVRWVTAAQLTGIRESLWVGKARAVAGPDEPFHHPGQAVFDDPALDADFPDHPLSTAREARRWLTTEAQMRLVRPQVWPDEQTAIEIPEVGYALVPPPRFGSPLISAGVRGRPWASMNRASFSGTDGIDLAHVNALSSPLRIRWDSTGRLLAVEVEKLAREVYVEAEVQRIRSTVIALDRVAGQPAASVLVEGDGHLDSLRMVVHGTARDGRIVSLFLTTTATLPIEEMLAEVNASLRTLRRL
jgi:hypothetical protein